MHDKLLKSSGPTPSSQPYLTIHDSIESALPVSSPLFPTHNPKTLMLSLHEYTNNRFLSEMGGRSRWGRVGAYLDNMGQKE